MRDFNRGGGSGGGGRFSGPRKFDNNRGSRFGDHSDRPAMHSAVCAECGNRCEVPFKPTGDKPVYCNNCFGKKAGFDNSRFDRRDSERPSFNRDDRRDSGRTSFSREDRGERGALAGQDYKQQFELLNAKLDNILKLLTAKPTVSAIEKPVKTEVKAKKTVATKKESKKVVAKKKK